MKLHLTFTLLFIQTLVFAQKPCEYVTNVIDSIGTLKETKACLVYEKVFGNTTQFIFLSLITDNGTPYLSLNLIQKSPDFIAPKCLNKDSKIFLELSNGKTYKFVNYSDLQCAQLVYNKDEKMNNRFLSVNYMFLKDDFDDLKKYAINFMKIEFSSETIDYYIAPELKSEKGMGVFEPEKFFMNNFKCIE
jgi:hypothetical protein